MSVSRLQINQIRCFFSIGQTPDLVITLQNNETYATIKLSGVVQKGPFISGTSITVQELSKDLVPTGVVYNTSITDDSGFFEIESKLKSPYIEVIATGYYFNEITGKLSTGPLTLRSLADTSSDNKVNINLLTTLMERRLKELYRNNKKLSFTNAKNQSQEETLAVFSIKGTQLTNLPSFAKMDISSSGAQNAILLSVCASLQYGKTVAELSEMISKFASDLSDNGVIDEKSILDDIESSASKLDISQITQNLVSRYSTLGIAAEIPKFQDYLDTDGDGEINIVDSDDDGDSFSDETDRSQYNKIPSVEGNPETTAINSIQYAFSPTASDPNGDALTFTAENLPDWLNLDVATGKITGTPSIANIKKYENIVITVSDGNDSVSLAPFSITVSNSKPVIGSTPSNDATTSILYTFIPTASDPDGDVLTFLATNLPNWLTLNTITGVISGIPQNEHIGTTTNIVLTVTDGFDSTALEPFAITVSNRVPTIGGTPSSQATTSVRYEFTPIASDQDNDPLTFSASNLPTWLTLNTSTGEISGIPDLSHIGNSNYITISVTDNVDLVHLAEFQINVIDNKLSIENIVVNESSGNATFQLSLSQVPSEQVNIQVSTVDGNAKSGFDFTLIDQNVIFQPGESAINISVPLINDNLDEVDETFSINTQAISSNITITSATVVGTITDEDPEPTISFTTADEYVIENLDVSIPFTLSGPSGRDLIIPMAFLGTATEVTDYTISSTTPLTIPAGNTTGSISINIIEDSIDEVEENIVVNIDNPSYVSLGTINQHIITIKKWLWPVSNERSDIKAGLDGTDFDSAMDSENNLYVLSSNYLAKYNSSGAVVWSKSLPDDGINTVSRSIYTGNNFIVVGSGLYIKKFTSDGNELWTYQLPTPNNSFTSASGVTSDTLGNIYASGTSTGDLAGNANDPWYNSFIVKLTSAGELVWIKQGTTSHDNFANDIAFNNGYIYLIKHLDGVFCCSPYSVTPFILKYDLDGTLIWEKQIETTTIGTVGRDIPYSLAFDSQNNFYIACAKEIIETGKKDAWLGKFDSNGNLLWSDQHGTDQTDRGLGVTIDSLDNVFTTGQYRQAGDTILLDKSNHFIAKYDSTGTKLWQIEHVTDFAEKGVSVTTDSDNNAYIFGPVGASVQFQKLFIYKYDSTGKMFNYDGTIN